MKKIYRKLFRLFNRLAKKFLHLTERDAFDEEIFGYNEVTSESEPLPENTTLKIVQSVWDELQAMEYILDNKQTTPEQRKEFLDDIDSLHEALLHAVEEVEQIADRLQESLP